MKLLLAILRDRDADPALDQLITAGHRVTRVASTGGFLKRGNVTLLIGTEADQVQVVLDTLRAACGEPDPGQHRATVFVLNAEHFEQV